MNDKSLKDLQYKVSQEAFRLLETKRGLSSDLFVAYQIVVQEALMTLVGKENVRAYGIQFKNIDDTISFELYNANSEE